MERPKVTGVLEWQGAHMRLLDRYITREVAAHAVLGLAVFTFVFFVPQLVRLMDLIVRHSGGAWAVGKLFLCSLPPVLTFTLPMAVLVGVLIGLGRLSADSEIVALHACGISLRRLLLPVGFVAAASALITLVMTFWLSPIAVRTLRSLEDELRSSQAPFAVQPRVFDERFPHFILYVQDVEAAATHWQGVFLAASGGQAGSTITIAEDATIIQNENTGENAGENAAIELHLGTGSTHEYDPREPNRYNVTTFGESAIPIDIASAPGAAPGLKNAAVSNAERSVWSLVHASGKDWRDARVELHRRIAFPAACLVFALLGVPVGVRPRRGGRATGLILTLVLIGGYYFLFVTGAHMAQQGSITPWLGIWIANIVALAIGLYLLGLIENIRKRNFIVAWFEARWSRFRKSQRLESEAAPMPASNGRMANGSIPNGSLPSSAAKSSVLTADGPIARMQTVAGIRRAAGAGTAAGFPMMIDFYLLQSFFYYFGVLLAGFVVIFDAFTLFDLLSDISKNHIPISMVLEFFRYLVPYFVYQLAPLATLVATLVTLAVLAKNNEVIAFKASGISLYRIVLPLTLAGCLIAGGMFLLDDTFLPYANQRQDALRNQIKGRPAQTYFQPARQWIMGEDNKIYNYELFDPDHQLFGGLNVFELDPTTFQIRRRVFATRATWEPTENTWALAGGWIRDFEDGRITRYAPFKVSSLAELTEPPNYFRREVRQSYQMNWRQLGSYIQGLQKAGFDTARFSVQWHRKFAFPLIAAIIVFLGAPFAFLVGTRGAVGGLALAVGVGIVYWATAALFEALGSAGQLPPVLAAWAPDAIFGFWGVYFFLRMPT